MNKTDLQTLADLRIDEAQALLTFTPPRPDAAYYLAGYAVECALKAAIATLFNQHDWPDKRFVNDCHTHDLLLLVKYAKLNGSRLTLSAANPLFEDNWKIVQAWNESSRYERHNLVKAQAMVDAVANTTNGVLPWIKAIW